MKSGRLRDQEVLACCTASYGHPVVRWLLGDSLHPGGLTLTTQLARLAGIEATSRVLDAGSGQGASAVHLARTIGCQVVGVTLEAEGVEAGDELARSQRVRDRVTFLQGDMHEVGQEPASFDVALMECVLSIQPDKAASLRHLGGLLRPGGRIAISDVTVNGPLPPELQGLLAMAGCVGGALSLDGYSELVENQGFTVDNAQDLPTVASSFLRDIRGKLMIAEAAINLGKLPVSSDLLNEGKRILGKAQDLVRRSVLSYGLVVGRRD